MPKHAKQKYAGVEASPSLLSAVANDRGVALVFALVLMVVLAIIGASATMTSQVDLQVSGNTKVVREAFYLADGGIELSPKVIARIISERALPTSTETPLITYDTNNLLGKVMGYIDDDDPNTDTDDIAVTQGFQGSIAVQVTRGATQYLSGGGAEFAAGTEGVGVGGAASTAVLYTFDSSGTAGRAPRTTIAQITATYRKVAGVTGGK